jgi:hypothetical protein
MRIKLLQATSAAGCTSVEESNRIIEQQKMTIEMLEESVRAAPETSRIIAAQKRRIEELEGELGGGPAKMARIAGDDPSELEIKSASLELQLLAKDERRLELYP